MSEYNRIFDFVQEMNQKWEKLNRDIESGKRRHDRARHITTVQIIDSETGIDYGLLSIDGNGVVQELRLNAEEVVRSNDNHVLALIRDTLNSDAARSFGSTGLTEYEVTP